MELICNRPKIANHRLQGGGEYGAIVNRMLMPRSITEGASGIRWSV